MLNTVSLINWRASACPPGTESKLLTRTDCPIFSVDYSSEYRLEHPMTSSYKFVTAILPNYCHWLEQTVRQHVCAVIIYNVYIGSVV